jgi:hypothetical protein
MTINCYQVAYENAISEISEIDAQLLGLTCRKELLEILLESLRPLVPESGFDAAPAGNAGDVTAEPDATGDASQDFPVVAFLEISQPEVDFHEASMEAMQPEIEVTNMTAGGRGAHSHEDIAALAYRFWIERGCAHGHHEEDWSRAASEVQNSAN